MSQQEALSNFIELIQANPEQVTELNRLFQNTLQQQTINEWDESEIQLLKYIVQCYCTEKDIVQGALADEDLEMIAQILQNKTGQQCKEIIKVKPKMQQIPWTKMEDKALKSVVEQFVAEGKINKWSEIAKEIAFRCQTNSTRLAKHCRERWINKLDPQIQKGPWGKQEEYGLLKEVFIRGKKWQEISKHLDNQRTENSLKNRYHSTIKKVTLQNDQTLTFDDIKQRLDNLNVKFNKNIMEGLGVDEATMILIRLERLHQVLSQAPQIHTKQEPNVEEQVQKKVKPNVTPVSHSKSLVQKILNRIPQDKTINYDLINRHFQRVVAQKGDTFELDEEPFSSSSNISEVQFAILDDNQQNLHIFPKEQLQAVLQARKVPQILKPNSTTKQEPYDKSQLKTKKTTKQAIKQESQPVQQQQTPVQSIVQSPSLPQITQAPQIQSVQPVPQYIPQQPQQQSNQYPNYQPNPQPMYSCYYPQYIYQPQPQPQPQSQSQPQVYAQQTQPQQMPIQQQPIQQQYPYQLQPNTMNMPNMPNMPNTMNMPMMPSMPGQYLQQSQYSIPAHQMYQTPQTPYGMNPMNYSMPMPMQGNGYIHADPNVHSGYPPQPQQYKKQNNGPNQQYNPNTPQYPQQGCIYPMPIQNTQYMDPYTMYPQGPYPMMYSPYQQTHQFIVKSEQEDAKE